MGRYRAVIAYDGTGYYGFQRLPGNTPTIQRTVEKALSKIIGQPVRIVGAGRTDTGVHATGQVIAFDLEWKHSAERLLSALNATLPTDIAVQRVEPAQPGFHPRYDAISRTYRYMLYNAPIRQPVLAQTAWHVWGTLNLERMNEAAAHLIGVHDFASFGAPPQIDQIDHGDGNPRSTIREVLRSEWHSERWNGEDGATSALLHYVVEANAFLYHMVRTMVGTLVAVGLERISMDQFISAVEAKDRARIGYLAPPHGLTLIAVSYAVNDAGRRPPNRISEEIQDI